MARRSPPSQIRAKADQVAAAGRLDEAVGLYRGLLEQEPEAYADRNRLAELLDRMGRSREALGEWSVAAADLERAGFLARAIGVWGKVVRGDPRNPDVRLRVAHLHEQQGHVVEAASQFIQAADLASSAQQPA